MGKNCHFNIAKTIPISFKVIPGSYVAGEFRRFTSKGENIFFIFINYLSNITLKIYIIFIGLVFGDMMTETYKT
jgi:hypothetical protein